MNQTQNRLRDTQRAPRITTEAALWMLIAVLALVLRLAHLDAAPLSAREAREAMLAWRAVAGQGMPEGGFSPVLFVADALLFALCSASDGLARLWPALLGGALALTPFLLRQRIGRLGALVTGLYLALSPTALFTARQLNGAVVAAVGGMTVLGGVVRFFDTGRRPWLTLSAGGLALAVASSPSAYGLILTLGLSWLLLALAWPNGGVQRLGELLRPHLRHVLVVFLLAGLALSTGLGWNPAGLGAAGDLLAAWLARFGPAADGVAASSLTLLAVYEPLALLFGLGGLVWASRRSHRFVVLLGLWVGLGGLLLVLMRGRTAGDTLGLLLPLAMLTGVATESLVHDLRERGAWLSEGLYLPVVVVLWAYSYLMLARSAVLGDPAALGLAVLTAGLQVLLAMIFGLAMGVDTALRAVGAGTGAVLLAITVSAGWRVATLRPADPRELLVRQPTAVEVRDLVQTLRDLSWDETGTSTRLPFTLEAAPDSVLAWYLRDFSAARRVDNLAAAEELTTVLVTARRDLRDLSDLTLAHVSGDRDYVGQDFTLRRSWNPGAVACTWGWPPRCNAAVEWLLFRSTDAPPVIDQWAVLWLRQDEVQERAED